VSNEQEKEGYGITVFRPGTPRGAKIRGIVFFTIFCIIILVQSCYWLFANSARPFVLGMPFGMFFIVLFIVVEFAALAILYFLESIDMEEKGGL
jgi:phosphoglycerol transferase MdoB-like AlkP superfamily enzyme